MAADRARLLPSAHPAVNGFRSSTVRLVVVYPDLLGTYGDGGNATVLTRRLRWRRLPVEVTHVHATDPVPRHGDLYLLGGGEDASQVLAAQRLHASPLAAALQRGATCLAVCAGLQLLGEWFTTPDGTKHTGLGVLDVRTDRAPKRQVGEVIAAPHASLGVGLVTGYENHQGRTSLGPGLEPFASVRRGAGNGIDGVDGCWEGAIIGTYLHGPVLARNPELADWLICRTLGVPRLPPIDLPAVAQLRKERLSPAALRSARRRP